MKKILTLLIILTCISLAESCTKQTKDDEEIQRKRILSRKMTDYIGVSKRLLAAQFHQLRIHLDFSGLESFKTRSESNTELYKFITEKLAPSVKDHLEKTFKVKETEKINLALDTCKELPIPEEIKGKEIDADLIIFISEDESADQNTLAWAGPCAFHSETGRPRAGRVAMNPIHIKSDEKHLHDQFATILHEIYHIIGFRAADFAFFINKQTGEKLGADKVWIENGSGTHPHLVISPKVMEIAKEHFGCPTLKGVPLEATGGSGTAKSHWEKMVLMNEFMVAINVPNPVVSKLTLALLEDSGWYEVDYSMGEPLFFGKGKGCGFLDTQTCTLFGETCDSSDKSSTGCFYDYAYMTFCSKDTYMNECEFYNAASFDYHDCRLASSKREASLYGGYLGPGGRCFISKINYGGSTLISGCFKAGCNSQNQVVLEIDGKEYTCLSSGQILNPSEIDGTVTCPDIEDFCDHDEKRCPFDCYQNGRCLEGKECYCYAGFNKTDHCKGEVIVNDSSTIPTVSFKNLINIWVISGIFLLKVY